VNPTKIIEKPFEVSTGARPVLYCRCDDGNCYTFSELSLLVGLARNSLYERYRRLKLSRGSLAYKYLKLKKISHKERSC